MTFTASVCLHRGHFTASGLSTQLVCPADHQIIVKSIELLTTSSTAVGVQVYVQGDAPQASVIILAPQLQQYIPVSWSGWVVLNPGDKLFVYAAAPLVDFWISGSLLSPKAPWNPPVSGETKPG